MYKPKSIFLVESPLQISCITDAGLYDINSVVIVRFNGINRNDTLIMSSIEGFRTYFFKAARGDKISLFLKGVFFFIKYFFFNGDVYIGDHRSNWMRFFNYLPLRANIYYLDDGFATIVNYEKISRKNNFFRKNLITRFNLKTLPHKNVYVKKYSIHPVSNAKYNNNVAIIGCALSANNILKRIDYINILKKVIKCHSNNGVVYFYPHRYEDIEVVNEINRFCTVHIAKVSIEDYFKEENEVPKVIISFASTALFNLAQLFPFSNVISVDVTSLMSDPKDQKRFGEVYNFLRLYCDSVKVVSENKVFNSDFV